MALTDYAQGAKEYGRRVRAEQAALRMFWDDLGRYNRQHWERTVRRSIRIRAEAGLAKPTEMADLLRARFPSCQVWAMAGAQEGTWQLSFMAINAHGPYRHWAVVPASSTLQGLSSLILRAAYPRGWH